MKASCGEPSPQSTSSVCVSAVPASEKLPVKVTTPFSSMTGVTVTPARTGSTFSTTTAAWAEPLPPSSSVTVAVAVRFASSANERLAVKVPAVWSTVACVTTPSPQSTSTVCVSSVPASVNEPATVAVPPSSTVEPVTEVTTGARFWTVSVAAAEAEPPSSSETVATTFRTASSSNRLEAVNVRAAWLTAALVVVPSPQSMTTECVSAGPASVKEPLTTAVPDSSMVTSAIGRRSGRALPTDTVALANPELKPSLARRRTEYVPSSSKP